MAYVIRPMEVEDIPEVTEIEKQAFTSPWPAYAYRRELRDNKLSRYIVAYWTDREVGETEPQRISIKVGHGTTAKPLPPQKSLVKRALAQLFPSLSRNESTAEAWAIAGYAGLWLMLDEAHVTTIAVRPELRGQGLGELLLIGLIDLASGMGARYVTLEVRVSNSAAQLLYRKYGLREEGLRKRYYSDNGEDALIMWSEPLSEAGFQAKLISLKAALEKKLERARPPARHEHAGM